MAATSLIQGIGVLGTISSVGHGKRKNGHADHRQSVKKVSWAPDCNLRQVRLFLAEDPPLQSGLDDQDHMQAKQSWLWHGDGSGLEGDLSPGYRNKNRKQTLQEDAIVPHITWCCPARFILNPAWQVVAGDESLEIDAQNQRGVRILEAIYPRLPTIPQSPAEPQEPQMDYDDSDTPIIPLNPVEDDESEDLDEMPLTQELCNSGMSSQDGNTVTIGHFSLEKEMHASLPMSGPSTDLGTSAAAAFLSIMNSNEKRCMIDQDLLFKIFNDPQMMEMLTSQHSKTNSSLVQQMPNNNKHSGPIASGNVEQHQNSLVGPQCAVQVETSGINGNDSSLMRSEMICSNFQGPPIFCNMEVKSFGAAIGSVVPPTSVSVDLSSLLPNTNLHSLPRPVSIAVTASMAGCLPCKGISTAAPTVSTAHNQSSFPDEQYYRDLIQKHGVQNDNELLKHQDELQYYKDLIQQHGGAQIDRDYPTISSTDGVGGGFVNYERPCTDLNKPKFRKPCLYFNTPNGCRRGTSCIFLHMDLDRPRLDVSETQYSKRSKAENDASERN